MSEPTESYRRWKATLWIEKHGEPQTPCEDDFCPVCGRPWTLCNWQTGEPREHGAA